MFGTKKYFVSYFISNSRKMIIKWASDLSGSEEQEINWF